MVMMMMMVMGWMDDGMEGWCVVCVGGWEHREFIFAFWRG